MLSILRQQNTAMMCAEEDPLHCHRFMLICPAVVQRGVCPGIFAAAACWKPTATRKTGFSNCMVLRMSPAIRLFSHGREAALEDALRLQSEQYAFRTSPEAIEYF